MCRCVRLRRGATATKSQLTGTMSRPCHVGGAVTVLPCHQCIVGTLDAGLDARCFARGALVVSIVGLAGFSSTGAGAAGIVDAHDHSGTRSQPIADQCGDSRKWPRSRRTLSQEEQQTSALDNRYDTAVQNLQNAQNALQTINASITQTKAHVKVDRKHLTNDAVKAYIYGTPQSNYASLFSSLGDHGRCPHAVHPADRRRPGPGPKCPADLRVPPRDARRRRSRDLATQAQPRPLRRRRSLRPTSRRRRPPTATLSQVQGQLATEVAQAAVEEAQQEAAAAARAASAAEAQREAAAAQAAATVAQTVGGSASGAAATAAANAAGGRAGGLHGHASAAPGRAQPNRWRSVAAAESQLGVAYVFGGASPSQGFDCSGLVQWAWGQAGVSIPRTTEVQWPALTHVSLDALEPGDLLFYYNLDSDNAVDHVVMYVGSGPYGTDTVIQAPFTGATVSYSPIFTDGLIGAGRP